MALQLLDDLTQSFVLCPLGDRLQRAEIVGKLNSAMTVLADSLMHRAAPPVGAPVYVPALAASPLPMAGTNCAILLSVSTLSWRACRRHVNTGSSAQLDHWSNGLVGQPVLDAVRIQCKSNVWAPDVPSVRDDSSADR
jgi:hypothetical protein